MQVSIQTDRRNRRYQQKKPQKIQQRDDEDEGVYESLRIARQKKIKKLTIDNRQLIERIKDQNKQINKILNKKVKIHNTRSNSVQLSPQQLKQIQSTKRELDNAYKQIDMYKSVLSNLKSKQISLEGFQKVSKLQNEIKQEEKKIQTYQKDIKYLKNMKKEQDKGLKIVENDEVRQNVSELNKELQMLKNKQKTIKKFIQKRQQLDRRQQLYQLELEKALREMNGEYFPGIQEKKQQEKPIEEEKKEITEREWQVIRQQLKQLKKKRENNTKQIERLTRLRNRQIKSKQQNQLKIKEKTRKFQSSKTKLQELIKLVKVKRKATKKAQNKDQMKEQESSEEEFIKKSPAKDENKRQAKKWIIPEGFIMEKGRILPKSIFFSDKSVLAQSKKTRIYQVNIWADEEQIPFAFQFFYEDENKRKVQGVQPIQIPSTIQPIVFTMRDGDYLHKVKGCFYKNQLVGIRFISKLGKQIVIQGQKTKNASEQFSFQPKQTQLPTTAFGAYSRKATSEHRVCHIGFQLITDW